MTAYSPSPSCHSLPRSCHLSAVALDLTILRLFHFLLSFIWSVDLLCIRDNRSIRFRESIFNAEISLHRFEYFLDRLLPSHTVHWPLRYDLWLNKGVLYASQCLKVPKCPYQRWGPRSSGTSFIENGFFALIQSLNKSPHSGSFSCCSFIVFASYLCYI